MIDVTGTPEEIAAKTQLWTPGDPCLNIKYLATMPPEALRLWLNRHDAATIGRMLTAWSIWGRDEQRPPDGDWHSWLFLGGRGAGKTRAGAEWVKSLLVPGLRVALVGPTLHDVREVMIDGPSGLRSVADPGNRPFYEVSRRRLRWPGGGTAYAFSAEEPERLRGPQFHFAWADEFCSWRAPGETLAQLRMGLRLGVKPRLCVTTTPKPVAALKTLMAEAGTVVTRSATRANLAGLADDFLSGLTALYGGTRLAAQELDGMVVEDEAAALWRAEDLARCYGARPPRLDALVTAVDPPATSHGDACGIVVAGRLWGLIACHNKTPLLTPPAVRGACDVIGQVLAMRLAGHELHANAADRVLRQGIHARLLTAMAAAPRFLEGLTDDADDLLALTGADGAAVVSAESCVCVGATPSETDIRRIVTWLGGQGQVDPDLV